MPSRGWLRVGVVSLWERHLEGWRPPDPVAGVALVAGGEAVTTKHRDARLDQARRVRAMLVEITKRNSVGRRVMSSSSDRVARLWEAAGWW